MEIGDRPFIIAEMSGNHNGDLEQAIQLIVAAKIAGCDAVKIQTYEPEDMNDPDNAKLYDKCKIPRSWHSVLFRTAAEIGIPLFSSVFSVDAVNFLKQFDCPAYKIASPESTRLSPLAYREIMFAIRVTGKMFMASSGRRDMRFMNSLGSDLMFYCVAGYPATIRDSDIEFFHNTDCDGFSDHTAGTIAPLAMIAAGATVIEKHFKLDDDCVDAAFAFNPEQMATLCRIAHQ